MAIDKASDKTTATREMMRLIRPGTSLDPVWFRFGERTLATAAVVDLLAPYLTDARRARIEHVLDERTYNLAVVVDGMVDTGNVAAVMRSADGFGLQAFHAVDTAGTYKHSKRTAQGVHKWLDRHRWRSVDDCAAHLRDEGHRIVVAHLDPSGRRLDEVDFSRRTAVVFGNELAGVSDAMLATADDLVYIPLSGFVESFNISVAAGITMYEARRQRVATLGHHGDLSAADRDRLRAVFWMKSVRHHRELIERLLADRG